MRTAAGPMWMDVLLALKELEGEEFVELAAVDRDEHGTVEGSQAVTRSSNLALEGSDCPLASAAHQPGRPSSSSCTEEDAVEAADIDQSEGGASATRRGIELAALERASWRDFHVVAELTCADDAVRSPEGLGGLLCGIVVGI